MTPAEDYQWPKPAIPRTFKRGAGVRRAGPRLRTVEEAFEKRLGIHAVLFPSARSGLSMILRLHGIDRSRVVHAAQWSSYCVWSLIGRYANPTVSFEGPPDVILAVHRWAQVARLSRPYPSALVVEDSVDTLFQNTSSLFPNGGKYELLSFPKILASYCGGAVLTRDAAAARALRETRSDGGGLAAHQSRLKYLGARGLKTRESMFQDWSSTEWNNTGFDENALASIEAGLRRYDEYAGVIRRRLDAALAREPRLASCFDASTGRLPSVLAVPCDDCEPVMDRSRWMLRRKNCSFLDRPDHRLCYLLPLHAAVSEARFEKMLSELRLKPRGGR